MDKGFDRQVEFERNFMGNDSYGDDWFIDDRTIESVNVAEYQMYLIDCMEVSMEDAT